uniref:Arginine vasopressin-induced protein 1 n=1 Tax=Geospiza parvula TaxID=87175 RepID=A0A8C3MWC2_GEOPR
MGTPASVVSDSPGRAAPAARARKRASANIFQGVGLRELRSLFRSGGAERPEERARLVWRYAGQRRMARALRRLRRRRTAQPGVDSGGWVRLWLCPAHPRVAEPQSRLLYSTQCKGNGPTPQVRLEQICGSSVPASLLKLGHPRADVTASHPDGS